MNYFQKRELEWQKQQIKDDKRRMAEIKTMMVELQDAIQEEIERNWYVFSSGQGISMEEAYKRSNELDVVRFAKKAKKYVKNRDFSSQANKELKLYNLTMRVNRLELLKANIGLELIRTFDEIDKYVSNELTTVAKEEMKRQAGILYIDVNKNEYTSMLKQIANGSFQGVEFSNLIWSYQNELKADLSKLLQRSIVLGRNPKMLAPELKKYLTEEGKLNAKFNTQRLMVSETTNIQIAIQKQSYLDAGIEKYGYNAEPNACSACAKLKDKTFLVSEMMPGNNAPSMHPFCRCSTYPVFELDRIKLDEKTGKTSRQQLEELATEVAHTLGYNPVPTNEVVMYLRSEAKKWELLLDDYQKRSINKYTFNELEDGKPIEEKLFFRVNSMLDGRYYPLDEIEKKTIIRNINNIETGIKKFNLKRDIIVYRNDKYPDSLMETVNKFLSTSVSTNGVLGSKPNVAVIVPSGSNGAYLELLADKRYKKQREFLINRKVEYNLLLKRGDLYVFELR